MKGMMSKYFITLLILVVSIFNGFSQQDNCAGTPPLLTVGASCSTTNYTVTSTWNNDGPAYCSGTSFRDGWFRFTTGAGMTSVTIDGTSNRNLGLAVYSTCGGAAVGCVNPGTANASLTITVSPSTTYLLRLSRTNNSTANDMTGTICVYGVSAPSNDACASATSLPCGTTNLAGTTVGTVAETTTPPTTYASQYGVWYTFTGTNQTTTISSTATFDHEMVFMSGSCGSLTYMTSIDATSGATETYSFYAATGTTYYVYIAHYSTISTTTGTFTISSSCVSPPANDDPCSATALTVGTSCSFNTYTTAGASGTTAGSPPAPTCGTYSGGDVWFTATVPASGELVFDTQTGVVLNGDMAIYSGSCGSLTQIACNNNAGTGGLGGNSMPYLSQSGLTPGSTVWIRFWENGNDNNGTFGICVWDPCPVCSGTPTAATISSSSTICSGNSQVLTAAGGSTGCQFRFQWQSSTDNIGYSDITGATTASYTASPTVTTYYRYIVTCFGSGLTATSNTVTLTVPVVTTSVTAPFTENFTGTCPNWVVVNGSQTNQWFMGSATGNPGQSMYITNDNGVTNAYTNTTTTTTHFYKDVDFPAGLTCITLTFDWKGVAESCCDEVYVYVIPTSSTPVAGTELSSTYVVGGPYNNNAAWQTASITLPSSYAGTTQRLVFSWHNDGSVGTQPPLAIDNIAIAASAPPLPGCVTAPSPANAATGVCPVNTVLSWTAPTGTCQNLTGYLLYFGTNAAATNIYNGTNIGLTTTYTLPTLTGSTVYYWKIVPVNVTGSATGCTTYSFTTSASPAANVCSSSLGTGVITVASLPYSLASGSTNGQGNDLTSANTVTCGSSSYLGGADQVYVFTPTSSGNVTISANFSTTWGGLMVYEGCPLTAGGCGASAGTCIGYSQSSSTGVRNLNICVQAGVTYYLVIDVFPTPNYSDYTALSISAPTGAPSNDEPCTAIDLPVGSTCTYATYSNACANSSTGIPAPGCANYLGSDVWFKATVPASGILSIETDDLVMTDGGMAVYTGSSCSSLSLLTCDDNSSSNASMPRIDLSGLTVGSVVYIRVWEYGNNNNGTFGICVSNPCPGGSPTNDACANATSLTLGTIVVGNNNCSSATGEPAKPSCWSSGAMNTVWYSFVAPASGQIKIRTIEGTLVDTQIEVFSGTCGSLTSIGCNDDASSCGGTYPETSLLTLTGLTSGATYYIRIDGNLSTTGSFGLVAVDGTSSFPGSSTQDCVEPAPVCNQVINVGDPGYHDYGMTCDLPTSYCLASGERDVIWYRIPINAAGNLVFDIVPNDYTGTAGPETDYDFGIWKVDGTTVTCATILAGSSTPIRCNYNSLGVTGLGTGGNAPAAYPGFDAAYETPIAVTSGEVYYLAISNYANSTSGFTIDFNASAPINYAVSPTSVSWTGGTNTAFNLSDNWGSCSIPACGINAEVTPASVNQPNITSAISPQRVKDIIINPGSTLTLGPNAILEVCGNFTNLGNLVCDPTSTIIFNGVGVNQVISGDLVGANKVGNLTVTKTSSSFSVILSSNIDIGGNFTTSNATSVFSINGYYMSVEGNFTNASGTTTFTGVANSTISFTGAAAQTYSPGGSLPLNNVTMSHSGPGVTITTTGTPNMIIGTAGILTLTNGKIITPGAQQVEVRNTANASVSSGNTGSYVEGNLRRYLAAGATGSFDFPVGESTKGYQRANLNFTTAASGSASQLLARFDAWGGGWPQPGAPGWGPECTATYNQPYLDNGYWSIDVASGASTGNYDITLYNTNYTNAAAGFSVGKSPSGAPAWALQGTCVGACPVTAVQRTGMTGFSKFATIQSSSVLPLQLLSFKGWSKGTYNELKWETAKEENLNYFELESSTNGFDFKVIDHREANNNSSSLNVYRYNDQSYYTPYTYYKLKSVDFNGEFRYSSVIKIDNEQKQIQNLLVYPNPATSEVNIAFDAPFDDEFFVEIIDVLGRVILSKSFNAAQGMNEVPLSINSLIEGTYIISCKFGTYPATNTRLVKQK